MKKMKSILLVGVMMAMVVTGCRPYNTPGFEEADSFETVFVIPLEGDIDSQIKFDSASQLDQLKVASRRITIPRRWRKTGRLYIEGEYIDTVKVIKVDRTPVTVEWQPDTKIDERTNQLIKTGDGIWVESSDSIGFSTGFRVTAQIEEEDASTYLYCYRGNSLEHVLENEVKSKVQEYFANFSAKYKLDDLRAKKNDMYEYTKSNILPYFKEKGISITTLAMFGGFTYENLDIQTAIDKTFIAQQEKVVSAAQLAAQDDKNSKIKMEAQAEAESIKIKAQAQAEAIKLEKQAEAEGISLVTAAAENAQKNPLVLALRKLEIEKLKNEKWDGQYPTYYMNTGTESNPDLLLSIPTP